MIAEETILRAVWKKAAELLLDSGSIVQAPGGTDFLVKSYSGSRPHLVKVKVGSTAVMVTVQIGKHCTCAPTQLQLLRKRVNCKPLYNGTKSPGQSQALQS